MVLSFAAFQQSLDTSFDVGTQVHADLFRYPGAVALRVLVGPRHGDAQPAPPIAGSSVADACIHIGRALTAEPWLERYPLCVDAALTRAGGRWLLTDSTGSLPLVDGASVGTLLACSAGRPATVVAETDNQVEFDDNGEPLTEQKDQAPLHKTENDPVVKKALEVLAKVA